MPECFLYAGNFPEGWVRKAGSVQERCEVDWGLEGVGNGGWCLVTDGGSRRVGGGRRGGCGPLNAWGALPRSRQTSKLAEVCAIARLLTMVLGAIITDSMLALRTLQALKAGRTVWGLRQAPEKTAAKR